MTNVKRSFILLFALVALTALAAPLMAGCRSESTLDIGQIVDASQTTLRSVGGSSTNFLVFFAVRSNRRVSFMCDRRPFPGCSKDGITYKSQFSQNVAAVNPTAECRAQGILTASTGKVVVGFRIRFEQSGSPVRKTFQLIFDTSNPSNFQLVSVPDPTDTSE